MYWKKVGRLASKSFLPFKVAVVRDASLHDDCASYTSSLGYECVPYTQCSVNGTILTDGAGLIEIRAATPAGSTGMALLDASDRKCPGMFEVCCRDPTHKVSTTVKTISVYVENSCLAGSGRPSQPDHHYLHA